MWRVTRRSQWIAGKEDSRNVKFDQEESLDGEMGLKEFMDTETGQEESLGRNTI